jgi:hypothetical protein
MREEHDEVHEVPPNEDKAVALQDITTKFDGPIFSRRPMKTRRSTSGRFTSKPQRLQGIKKKLEVRLKRSSIRKSRNTNETRAGTGRRAPASNSVVVLNDP